MSAGLQRLKRRRRCGQVSMTRSSMHAATTPTAQRRAAAQTVQCAVRGAAIYSLCNIYATTQAVNRRCSAQCAVRRRSQYKRFTRFPLFGSLPFAAPHEAHSGAVRRRASPALAAPTVDCRRRRCNICGRRCGHGPRHHYGQPAQSPRAALPLAALSPLP